MGNNLDEYKTSHSEIDSSKIQWRQNNLEDSLLCEDKVYGTEDFKPISEPASGSSR